MKKYLLRVGVVSSGHDGVWTDQQRYADGNRFGSDKRNFAWCFHYDNEQGHGFFTTVVANEAGAYTILSLLPGAYTLAGELTGFQKRTYSSVELGNAVNGA